jgi:hypothetical protein
MKKGKTAKISGFNNAKVIYGTVDSKNFKSVYLNIESWVTPKDEYENWERIVSNITFKQISKIDLDPEQFKSDQVVSVKFMSNKI